MEGEEQDVGSSLSQIQRGSLVGVEEFGRKEGSAGVVCLLRGYRKLGVLRLHFGGWGGDEIEVIELER